MTYSKYITKPVIVQKSYNVHVKLFYLLIRRLNGMFKALTNRRAKFPLEIQKRRFICNSSVREKTENQCKMQTQCTVIQ